MKNSHPVQQTVKNDLFYTAKKFQGNHLPPEMQVENEGPLRISHMSEKSARLQSQQGQVSASQT